MAADFPSLRHPILMLAQYCRQMEFGPIQFHRGGGEGGVERVAGILVVFLIYRRLQEAGTTRSIVAGWSATHLVAQHLFELLVDLLCDGKPCGD